VPPGVGYPLHSAVHDLPVEVDLIVADELVRVLSFDIPLG